jgi:hypothetical protein
VSLTVEELRELSRLATAGRWGPPDPDSPEQLRLSSVDPAEVAAHLGSEDRNVRVAALRVLGFGHGPAAVEGILRGLDDPVKRVREVAAKSAPRFISDPRVVARLQKAVAEGETGSARPAFQVLAGTHVSTYGLTQFEPITEALAGLARLPRYRQQVLAALVRSAELTEATTALLRDYVTSGSKAEAVAATRRLCGFRVVRKELLSEEQLRVAERAWGDVWFWVPETGGS